MKYKITYYFVNGETLDAEWAIPYTAVDEFIWEVLNTGLKSVDEDTGEIIFYSPFQITHAKVIEVV